MMTSTSSISVGSRNQRGCSRYLRQASIRRRIASSSAVNSNSGLNSTKLLCLSHAYMNASRSMHSSRPLSSAASRSVWAAAPVEIGARKTLSSSSKIWGTHTSCAGTASGSRVRMSMPSTQRTTADSDGQSPAPQTTSCLRSASPRRPAAPKVKAGACSSSVRGRRAKRSTHSPASLVRATPNDREDAPATDPVSLVASAAVLTSGRASWAHRCQYFGSSLNGGKFHHSTTIAGSARTARHASEVSAAGEGDGHDRSPASGSRPPANCAGERSSTRRLMRRRRACAWPSQLARCRRAARQELRPASEPDNPPAHYSNSSSCIASAWRPPTRLPSDPCRTSGDFPPWRLAVEHPGGPTQNSCRARPLSQAARSL